MQYNYSSLLNRDAAPESHQVRPESLKTLEPSAINYSFKILVVSDWFKAPRVILHNQTALTKFGRCQETRLKQTKSQLFLHQKAIIQQVFPKKTFSNLCTQKQDQFNEQAVRWTKPFWINDLLHKNKISQGTLMTFLSVKRY